MTSIAASRDLAIRVRRALERAMTQQAELLLSMLGASLPAVIRPRVVIREDKTASTDGKRSIRMPVEFNGISLMQPEFHWARTALLAHELGHWMQPMDEIQQVEDETGLNHDIVNIVMDVQDEALVATLLPYYNEHMTRLRRHVGKRRRTEYVKSARKFAGSDFLATAIALTLIGRYTLYPTRSFYDSGKHRNAQKLYGSLWPDSFASGDGQRMAALLGIISGAASIAANALPALLREIAEAYPELCNDTPPLPFPIPTLVFPQDSPLPPNVFGDLLPDDEPLELIEGELAGHNPPSTDEQKTAAAMRLHFAVPKGGIEIMAPGRFDRLAALGGSPMPWSMTIQDDVGRTKIPRAFIAVDISGSMSRGGKWDTAISAARSITLAVKAAGGDVRGLVFNHSAYYAKECDSKLFFSASVSGSSLLKAHGQTTFEWLPYFWQKYPAHHFVIITDGGHASDFDRISFVSASQQARTGAIVIPRGDAGNMLMVAANVVEVRSLNLLVGAMTSVLPRRSI